MALKIHWRLEWKRLPVTLRAGVAMTVAAFALIVSVHAAPAPSLQRCEPSMVQQSIPMADRVHLFRHSLHARLGEGETRNSRRCSNIFRIARTMPPPRGLSYPLLVCQPRYVSVRVDIRGFGTSEGVPTSANIRSRSTRRGASDCMVSRATVVERQVGMFGISWGGFNSIQMAMRHPPALRPFLPSMLPSSFFTMTSITSMADARR